MNIIISLIVAALIGYVGGLLTKGKGFGILGNVIVGVAGAVTGLFLAHFFGFELLTLGSHVIASVAGAVVIITLFSIIF